MRPCLAVGAVEPVRALRGFHWADVLSKPGPLGDALWRPTPHAFPRKLVNGRIPELSRVAVPRLSPGSLHDVPRGIGGRQPEDAESAQQQEACACDALCDTRMP